MVDRLPPHDIDAEEAVIGSLLIDGKAIIQITSLLPDASYFYHERNQWLYEACLSLYQRDEAINQITLAQELDRRGKLETCGGAAYLSHLVSIVPTSLDIEHYAQIVYRLALSRRLIEAARQIEMLGYGADPDVENSLSKAEGILLGVRHGETPGDFVHIRQVLDKYFEVTPPPEDSYNAPITHVLTRFAGLDEMLGGLQPSDLIIVAARPSMGKTSLILNIARNAALEQGACVALFSLEMAREPLVLRLLSSESGVNLSHIRLGLHTETEEKRVMDATGILSEAKIYIDDSPRLRLAEMRSKARRLFYEQGVNLIIVDHLGLIDGQMKDRVQEISQISRSLKGLARELNIPVIAVSQLSRASEWRASHKPQLSDLRDSGSIEQDADVVMFIYREEYYSPDREEWEAQHIGENYPEGLAEIIIAKHRNGPIGQVNLRFVPRLAKFENIANQEPSML
ncbi:MAG: replicative DNA helicase [Chloroflexi bacterium RBG_16_51_9]|nr:MAG: replicative DNA helicase [Chloroflexi bacterium RBG_16_51_9]